MAKYRTIPVEVEAFQWTGDINQVEDPVWVKEALQNWPGDCDRPAIKIERDRGPLHVKVQTIDRIVVAWPRDYIVKDKNNFLSVCHPDDFEKAFEIIADNSSHCSCGETCCAETLINDYEDSAP